MNEPDSLAGEDGAVVLNPSAIGNPDETPQVWLGADLRALLGDEQGRAGTGVPPAPEIAAEGRTAEPTDDEIEAAARATMDIPMPFCGGHARARFTVACQECRADAESHARRALAAALPLIRERIAAEIAAQARIEER